MSHSLQTAEFVFPQWLPCLKGLACPSEVCSPLCSDHCAFTGAVVLTAQVFTTLSAQIVTLMWAELQLCDFILVLVLMLGFVVTNLSNQFPFQATGFF